MNDDFTVHILHKDPELLTADENRVESEHIGRLVEEPQMRLPSRVELRGELKVWGDGELHFQDGSGNGLHLGLELQLQQNNAA